jgi:hypothetical protein
VLCAGFIPSPGPIACAKVRARTGRRSYWVMLGALLSRNSMMLTELDDRPAYARIARPLGSLSSVQRDRPAARYQGLVNTNV